VFQDVVLIEPAKLVDKSSDEDGDEAHEGKIIRKLRDYLLKNPESSPIIVFVESLHLVGINSQLGDKSQIRIVPIELLVLYAAFHEAACHGITRAWLLPHDALAKEGSLNRVESPFRRTTYRSRQELARSVPDNGSCIVGVLREGQENAFRGFLTDKLDTRRIGKNDRILVL
jgi:hypothetical protein